MSAARTGMVVLALSVSAVALPIHGSSNGAALRSHGSEEQVRIESPSSQADSAVPATVALVETWPDGRINYELTSPRRATMWTPMYPRVEGYRPPEGATPVYAVQFARVLVGRDIKVDVSVLLGSAQPPGVPVASVVVSPGSHIVIGELTKFGVQPVTLSMVEAASMTPYLPTVVSASPRIEISNVELLNSPYPGYRVTLRNLGSKGASNVHVQSYRGGDKALSALKRADDGRPMMQPGASYTFDMNLTSGGPNGFTTPGTWSPRPIDLIEFDSVRWDDGTYDGTPPFPGVDAAIESDSGRRLQLRRIVDVLARTLAQPRSGLEMLALARTRIDALADAEPDQLDAAKLAMQSTKAVVRADIARFERDQSSQPSASVVEWLTSLLSRYQAWLTRLSPP
jgi:hypothetical protein